MGGIKPRNPHEVTSGRKKSYLSQFLLKNCVESCNSLLVGQWNTCPENNHTER